MKNRHRVSCSLPVSKITFFLLDFLIFFRFTKKFKAIATAVTFILYKKNVVFQYNYEATKLKICISKMETEIWSSTFLG